ncbi:4-alpha-glucanotransferase [uncultured Ruegeria sp.]|uniref:4-alpha-glucanotransferase n=1 Tax=uncultured Ruegeria sp. TaxID=259304 RepID=UPI00261A3709|nr:4-alpha-glucanotransferase [uncultured Ruegeria sp.]
MNSDDTLRQLAQDCGIHLGYDAWDGTYQRSNPPTLKALLRALDIDVDTGSSAADTLRAREAKRAARTLPAEQVIQAEAPFEFTLSQASEWHVLDDDGHEVQAGRGETTLRLGPLPVGYFTLVVRGPERSEDVFLLSRPSHAPILADLTGQTKGWGVSGAVYGLRSQSNGGVGNYGDLGQAMSAMGPTGAMYFGINPVHALGWAAQDTISPYSPSHRGFLNIDHIATDTRLEPASDSALIDYPAFRQKHRPALEADFQRFQKNSTPTQRAEFQKFCDVEGQELACFATFESLSEAHGSDFRSWPEKLRRPETTQQTARDAFHAWLQWRAFTQIGAAQSAAVQSGMALGLYLDLAVGARPGGAEVWMHQDLIARGVSIGAPPDQLGPAGQSWTLAAYAPNKLAKNRYEPLRTLLRKLTSQAGIIRIDHVLGLMRGFWVPEDGSPGGYISQPFDALLAVVAIEAWRNRCCVVGEDLGLVPDGFRERLNASGLYSYAVWQFEGSGDGALRSARDLRPFSMACFGTHDTPTIRGFWRGRDIEWWHSIGWLSRDKAMGLHGARAIQRNSLRGHCAIPPETDLEGICGAVHSELGKSSAELVTIQLDDLLGSEQAQNLPGTIEEHPNWRRPAAVPVEKYPAVQSLNDIRNSLEAVRGVPSTVQHKEIDPCPS